MKKSSSTKSAALKPKDTIHLEVLTPTGTVLDEQNVAWVQVWLADGSLGIWPKHAPLVAETVRAPLRYARITEPDRETAEYQMTLEGGVLIIQAGKVVILMPGPTDNSGPDDKTPDQGAASVERLLQALCF